MEHLVSYPLKGKQMKQCTKCGETKPLDRFRQVKNRKQMLTYRSECRECEREASRLFEQENREKRLEAKRLFYIENREKETERGRTFYAENVEKERQRQAKWREANREYLREKDKRHAKENPAYFVYKTQKRHTAKLKRTPSWLSEEHWKEIKTEYELAAWCSEVMGEKYNVDHIVPLQGKTVCGLHVPWNLQVIPAKDNFKKGNRFNG